MADDCRGPRPQTNAGINGVHASGGAHVDARIDIDNSYNKQLIVNLYLIFLKEFTPDPMKASQLQHRHIRDFVIQSLRASSSGEGVALQMQDPAALEDETNPVKTPAQTQLCLDELVNASAVCSRIEGHEGVYAGYKRGYDLHDSMSFPERISRTCKEAHRDSIQEALKQWLVSSTRSTILTIDGSEYTHIHNWPTRFAVEAVRDAEARGQPVCHHFCGARPRDSEAWPPLVVRHLLAQLPIVHDTGPTNGSVNGRQERLSLLDGDGILNASPASILWMVFRGRMVRANIDSVTIVLDRIDALYGRCRSNDQALESFADFVDGLRWLMHSGPAVRVMVTSGSSEPLEQIRRGVLAGESGDQGAGLD
ncbi:uncharacterized protein B0T15DRAFT_504068 [Chaetomium strumarium]|uniref:Uncharacterized protein n=1 Tax=Chaetomium strumarium TaxID=1170767 RepID=A0AAJ0GS26_9PEZI|nr:hypothetical protein B0T15DRAFT_504068 [Chaetomium strumarium]